MSKEVEGNEGLDNFDINQIPAFNIDSMDYTPDDDIQENGGDLTQGQKSQESQESVNKLILEHLKNQGIIDYNPDEYEDSDEAFRSVLDNNFDQKAHQLSDEKLEAKMENLPEVYKQIFGLHKEGIDVQELLDSQDRLAQYTNIQKQDYSDNKELQKNIVLTWLADQDFDEKEALAQVEEYTKVGDDFLKAQADLALRKLITSETKTFASLNEQAEEIKAKKEESTKNKHKEWEKSINDLKEIVPGVKITDIEKKKIHEILTKPVGRDAKGRYQTLLNKMQQEDPTFLFKVAYFGAIHNWDFSKFKKQATTEALTQLKGRLDSNITRGTVGQDDIISKLKKLRKQ